VRVEVQALRPGALASLAGEWSALEARTGAPSPYLTYEWLSRWAEVYRPRVLLLVSGREDGVLVALGLIEVPRRGVWHFAGRPVTPERGLLCLPGREAEVWSAFGSWLEEHSGRWALLTGEGLDESVATLPGTKHEPVTVTRLDLPETFDEYLAGRSSMTRRTLRKKIRRVERAGGAVLEVGEEERREAIETCVRLHTARTLAQGERHPAVDHRLAQMLEAVGRSLSFELRVFTLSFSERPVAVFVRLDHGLTAYGYQIGVDPEADALSPGIVIQLRALENAIEQGMRRLDMGPGAYRYKTDLGGVPFTRYRLTATCGSVRGQALALGMRARSRAREHEGLAAVIRKARRRLPR